MNDKRTEITVSVVNTGSEELDRELSLLVNAAGLVYLHELKNILGSVGLTAKDDGNWLTLTLYKDECLLGYVKYIPSLYRNGTTLTVGVTTETRSYSTFSSSLVSVGEELCAVVEGLVEPYYRNDPYGGRIDSMETFRYKSGWHGTSYRSTVNIEGIEYYARLKGSKLNIGKVYYEDLEVYQGFDHPGMVKLP